MRECKVCTEPLPEASAMALCAECAIRYAENPPDDWEECGQCAGWHPPGTEHIDCRDDSNRWPSRLTGGVE